MDEIKVAFLDDGLNMSLLSEMEKDFCRSLETKNKTNTNALVLYTGRVVFNEIIESTDLYGKPYTVLVHNGGVNGIAKDAKEILNEDFRDHLDLNLYKGISPETPVVQPGLASAPQPPANGIVTERTQAPDTPVHSSPTGNRASDQLQENTIIKADDAAPQEQVQLSLFNLFGSTPQASVVAAPATTAKRKNTAKKTAQRRQPGLFDNIPIRSAKPFNNTAAPSPKTNGNTVGLGDLFSAININNDGALEKSKPVEQAAVSKAIPAKFMLSIFFLSASDS